MTEHNAAEAVRARRHTKLPNGLTIIGEITPHSKSAALGYFVNTGARDETKSEAGVSHFLEHMVFKGTERRKSIEITFQLGAIGAQSNAYTNEESTVFYGAVLPEHAGALHEIIADMMRPSLDADEFEMERKVILEEIALYQDRPHFYLFEHALEDFFGGHPAGNSVLGSQDSIRVLPRDAMAAYHRRRYVPSNMIAVASGALDWDQFVADATRYSEAWGRADTQRIVTPHTHSARKKIFRRPALAQAHVLFVAGGAAADAQERYDLAVLSMIMGDGGGSKIYWDLVDSGLAESAGAEHDERHGTGVWMAYAGTDPANLGEVRERLQAIIARPFDFAESELERAKTKLVAKLILGSELPMGRLMALGNEWLYRGRLHDPAATIKAIEGVTRRSIEAALAVYPLNSFSEYHLIPEDSAALSG